jgi:hypothetical protein
MRKIKRQVSVDRTLLKRSSIGHQRRFLIGGAIAQSFDGGSI